MRYLQTEWQRNERDRIQWELERAEMKTRIARLEGEKRGLQLLVEDQAKKLKILQASLKQADNGDDVRGLLKEAQEQFDGCVQETAEADVSQLVESRHYLEKCIQEVEYLLQASSLDHQAEPEPEPEPSGRGAEPDEEPEPQQQMMNRKKQHNDWAVKFALETRSAVRCVASGFDNELVGGCQDGGVCVWKFMGTKKTSREFAPHEHPVSALAVAQGDVVFTADVNGTVAKWPLDPDPGSEGEAEEPQMRFSAHGSAVRRVLPCEADVVATASDDGTVKVWRLNDEAVEGTPASIVLMPSTSEALHAAPAGVGYYRGNVVVGYSNGSVEMFDVDTGASVHSFEVRLPPIRSLTVLLDHKLIVTGHDDGTIRFVDIQSKECTQTIRAHARPVTNLSVTAAERHLISSSTDSFVKLWNMVGQNRGQLVYSLEVPGSAVDARYICDNFVAVKSTAALKIYDTKEDY
ncbi:hypothetical protein TRICI_005679 [Trichomonascus ciferrii]|uniref:Striatin N-terminal domain-containing protein n=1 Tax=Trichomonascus ciferrii TaxID=44093 RepID=A0A642UQC2_9ASCO|nr:hypothetical protein TRICI_005679 [Trichomonascus ciferrii]